LDIMYILLGDAVITRRSYFVNLEFVNKVFHYFKKIMIVIHVISISIVVIITLRDRLI